MVQLSTLQATVSVKLPSPPGQNFRFGFRRNSIVFQKPADMGFVFEHFGDNSYLLRGVPTIFHSSDPRDGFLDVVTKLSTDNIDDHRETAAKTIACHSAIRAGKKLSIAEMEELIKLLEICNQPQTCPHGRPTVIHLTNNYLETQFGRR